MEHIASDQIRAFLTELGQRSGQPDVLVLLGGSALCMLGSDRPTLDIDYVGDDLRKNELQQLIDRTANELQISVEAVPIGQFVPMPNGADERRLLIGRFGSIDAYVLDPYTIALSKLDRGFDTDIEDVVFLVRRTFITYERLQQVLLVALERASEFDLDSAAMRTHLMVVRNLIE
jgi:hypothetical protein